MRCNKHPKYQAARRPTAQCKCCWYIWLQRRIFIDTQVEWFGSNEDAE